MMHVRFGLLLSCLGLVNAHGAPRPVEPGSVGPGSVIVHSMFRSQIFGFDIDQNGTEGVLSENKLLAGNKVLATVETFDQATGKILKVVQALRTRNNYLTLGVVGTGIGLVENEISGKIYIKKRTYETLQPLGGNAITGNWPAPLAADDIIMGLSRTQGTVNTVFFGNHNTGIGRGFVLGSNVAAGTFGPKVTLKNQVFAECCGAQVGYDSVTNMAVIAASTGAVGGPPPVIALVDLATGSEIEFNGLPGPPPYRSGYVNGMAVDSQDGIAVTTTELDFSVEFYDLAKHTGFAVQLPGANNQLQNGSDVEFDPVNKLFLVAQSESSTARTGSSIHVFDVHGNLIESLNGFQFSNFSNIIGTHIALNPALRSGFIDGPDLGVTELQSFTY